MLLPAIDAIVHKVIREAHARQVITMTNLGQSDILSINSKNLNIKEENHYRN